MPDPQTDPTDSGLLDLTNIAAFTLVMLRNGIYPHGSPEHAIATSLLKKNFPDGDILRQLHFEPANPVPKIDWSETAFERKVKDARAEAMDAVDLNINYEDSGATDPKAHEDMTDAAADAATRLLGEHFKGCVVIPAGSTVAVPFALYVATPGTASKLVGLLTTIYAPAGV